MDGHFKQRHGRHWNLDQFARIGAKPVRFSAAETPR